MLKRLLFILLSSFALKVYAQTPSEKVNSVGISIPIIWNNSKATYYSLGTRIEPTGKAVSYGLNINYSRTIYRNIFGMVGAGYFKQNFDIVRPFKYVAPDLSKPLVQTTTYTYNNYAWFISIGYLKPITKRMTLTGALSYNSYNTYKQVYNQNYFPSYPLEKNKYANGRYDKFQSRN